MALSPSVLERGSILPGDPLFVWREDCHDNCRMVILKMFAESLVPPHRPCRHRMTLHDHDLKDQ